LDGLIDGPVAQTKLTGYLAPTVALGAKPLHLLHVNLPARASTWVLVLRGAFR
jgi:hypothetical protein